MFDGITRRVVSLWFPRLASDRVLRARPVEGPFALTLREQSTERLYCLNARAERLGLVRGMGLSDARALCPDLLSAPAVPANDARFLQSLRRWALRYCPWAGLEGADGLVLDVTGSTHLVGGEEALITDIRARLARAGLSVRIGLADTRGAAWAIARHGQGIAAPGDMLDALGELPVAALRLEEETAAALQRLGLRTITHLAAQPRAPLTRRFGPGLLERLDQALGRRSEQITPLADPPHYGVRMTLPEPIGLTSDVMAATARLLDRLCPKLATQHQGARTLQLTLRRVDMAASEVELRLASPRNDAPGILHLFERGIDEVDAGFGIDQIRLEAVEVEPLPPRQISETARGERRLNDLITRLGTRIGIENILRFLPADSHIPERSFIMAAAAYSTPEEGWACPRARPLRLFPPEPIAGTGVRPPGDFRWRAMHLTCGRIIGPERIAPEWWLDDPAWRTGLRDYWRVETRQGRRLWLFHTPQKPAWFVQGEFA